MNDVEGITELQLQGFCCSQILVILGLEARGQESPELVRAAHALCGGLGSGEVCGTLTGAACLLGLYAGRGGLTEMGNACLGLMLQDLGEWFQQEIGQRYGGIRCAEILDGEPGNQSLRCPGLIVETWQQACEILESNGYSLDRWA